jgi:NAD(P)-dependent dehydrogenase (short-subunit alcohol dehydrogenase family)
MSPTTPLPLAGKSALVTGAARSIGADIALTLARRGAKVVVHYRSRDTEANQTVDAIREMGAEAVAIDGDLTDLDVVRTLFARTIDHFGGVDVVVANAGAPPRSRPSPRSPTTPTATCCGPTRRLASTSYGKPPARSETGDGSSTSAPSLRNSSGLVDAPDRRVVGAKDNLPF